MFNRMRMAGGLLVAIALVSQVAVAEPNCTQEPKEKWMSMLDMQKKIVNEYGYVMAKFKLTDSNCYEIYGYQPKEGEEDKMQKVKFISIQ